MTTSRIALYKECRYLETSEREVKPAAGFMVFINLPSHSFPLNLLAAMKELWSLKTSDPHTPAFQGIKYYIKELSTLKCETAYCFLQTETQFLQHLSRQAITKECWNDWMCLEPSKLHLKRDWRGNTIMAKGNIGFGFFNVAKQGHLSFTHTKFNALQIW